MTPKNVYTDFSLEMLYELLITSVKKMVNISDPDGDLADFMAAKGQVVLLIEAIRKRRMDGDRKILKALP